jgi:uncharacterized membrane protein
MTETNELHSGTGQEPKAKFGDEQMEASMGRLLQVGVLLAATIVAIGGAIYLRQHAGDSADFRTFKANPIYATHAGAIFKAVVRGDAAAIIELGILFLVSTPICRVLFAVVAFAIERDRLYVAISLAVLGVLAFGLVHGA